jgi:predicted transcriptional regulator of viral defense system
MVRRLCGPRARPGHAHDDVRSLTRTRILCKILISDIRFLQVKRDPQENAQALYQIADAQGGYFTAAQARQSGYAYSQQHFHVERGNWQRVDRGLFRLRDYPPGEREDLIRWSLWSRNQKGAPQAVVSHDTALTVHELSDLMPAWVHLKVPPGFRKRIPPGCVLHKGRLSPGDVEAGPGFQVTTPLRTLLDVADSPLSQEHLNAAVREALERGLVRRRRLEEEPCPPGARRRLDRALAAFEEGAGP